MLLDQDLRPATDTRHIFWSHSLHTLQEFRNELKHPAVPDIEKIQTEVIHRAGS